MKRFLLLAALALAAFPAFASDPPANVDGLTVATMEASGAHCAPAPDIAEATSCAVGDESHGYVVKFNAAGQPYMLMTVTPRSVDSKALLKQTYGEPGVEGLLGDAYTMVWVRGVQRRIAFLYPTKVQMALENLSLSPARSTALAP